MANSIVRLFVLSIILSLSISQTVRAEDSKEDHAKKKTEEAADSSRKTSDEELFPKKYDEVIKALEKSISMKAIGADSTKEKPNDKIFKIGGEEKDFAEQLKVLKEYREKLKSCESDEGAKALSKVLDGFIAKLHTSVTGEVETPVSGVPVLGAVTKALFPAIDKDKNHLISEKMVNTYVLQIKKFLDEKAKKQSSSADDFKSEDEKVSKALDSIGSTLWAGKFRAEVFKEEAALKDSSTKKVVENTKAAIEKIGEKACKLVTSTEEDKKDDDKKTDEEKKTGDDKKDEAGPIAGKDEKPVDPTPDQGNTGGNGGSAGGATTSTTPPAQDFNDLFRQFQDRAAADNQLAQNQLREALDAARRAVDDAALRQAQNDELNRALLDNNQLNNDALGEALRALGQQEPPSNRSANRENSDSRSPQISPSIDSGKGGGQPQIPPPQPQQPPPPPQGLPLGAMMQPPQTPTINLGGYGDSKRWDDEAPKRPVVPVTDPRTSGLMELLKLQQQLLMNSQQQRMQGGVGNVNSIGGRLSAFGARSTSARRSVGRGRINGTASSGTQGRIGANSMARTKAPR